MSSSPRDPKADDLISKIMEESMKKRAAMIETLILGRVRLTGEDVRDFCLVEEYVTKDGRSYITWNIVNKNTAIPLPG